MRALHIAQHDHTVGARIGGAVPLGQEHAIRDSDTQYFGTFPVSNLANLEFSVFHRFEVFDAHPTRDVLFHNNKVLLPSDLIWVSVHGHSERGLHLGRPFESRAVDFEQESPDEQVADDGHVDPYSESKLGGRCFLLRYWLQDDVSELEHEGFTQLLQIGLTGGDVVEGFPWDPGYLHVWARDPTDPTSYRFMIEQ